ncbi:MAG: transporter [Akkermansiaceae bacterium]|nr:transporter [Akkermansiaceae bacterium]
MSAMPIISRMLAPMLLATTGLLAQEPAAVKVVAPAPATANRTYDLPGRTEPVEQARIFARATGIIQERPVDIGDQVKAGDILAVIAIPEIDRGIEAAKATIEQATARAKNAKSIAARSAELLNSRAVSKEETEQRESSSMELEAGVRVAEAELAKLLEEQKFATVRAPFDAVVSGRRVDRGDFVRGDAATTAEWMFQLIRIDQLRFAVGATPDVALRLKPGSPASVRFSELPGQAFPAKVSRSSMAFDTTSGTMRLELLLENKDLTLPSGFTGTVSFNLEPAAGTFLLPNNTLLSREGKTTVATVKDGKVAFVEVVPGRNLGPKVEVTSAGLSPDSRVVVSPNALMRAGDAVNATDLAVAGK